MHDIYDPPPAPVAWEPPHQEPLTITTADIAWLLGLCGLFAPFSAWAWAVDAWLGLGVTAGGMFVILESWFSGITFLRRHPRARPVGRGLVFLAAMVPWLIGMGLVVALLLLLFWLTDILSGTA